MTNLAQSSLFATRGSNRWFFSLLLIALLSATLRAQAPAHAASASAPQAGPAQTKPPQPDESTTRKPTNGERRRAAKLFLESSKLYESGQFEKAMVGFEQATKLDPSNRNYALSVAVARSHAVTALIQSAALDRNRGDSAAAREALAHALELDPTSAQAIAHLHELGDDLLRGQVSPLYAQGAAAATSAPDLAPTPGKHTFHLHTDSRQTIQQVFKAYGLTAAVDDSVRGSIIRFDLEDASFEQATRALGMVTASFYVPLDAHRVLVARNTADNRRQFMREDLETVYLPGLSQTELNDVGNLAKNVFDVSQSVTDQSAGTLTLRGSVSKLDAFNATMRDLLGGRSQILLDVRMIQLARNNSRNTGAQLPQQMGVFNISAEAQSILNANQSLVQQIISSGLAAPGDVGAILAILLASGQVSSSLLSGGIATFGGSCSLTSGTTCSPTAFGLVPGPATLNLSLNSSASRQLDDIQLRVGDGETGTVRSGTRYPITTSSFSGLGASVPNIPGLNTAGLSGSLQSLLANAGTSVPNIPMVEYQDLGLTLKVTPKVLRDNDVALTVDLKVTALAGQSLNDVPVLANRAYSGVVTLRQGEGVVVAGEVDIQESRAISGMPGLSEIPGLNNVTDKTTAGNYATLLIVMTPHVVRGDQPPGHSPMLRVERNTQTR